MTIFEGWIYKSSTGKLQKAKGGKKERVTIGSVFGKWDKRYMVLDQDGTLTYFKKESDAKSGAAASGTVVVKGCHLNRVHDTRPNILAVYAPDRVLLLRADDASHCKKWADALKRAGATETGEVVVTQPNMPEIEAPRGVPPGNNPFAKCCACFAKPYK